MVGKAVVSGYHVRPEVCHRGAKGGDALHTSLLIHVHHRGAKKNAAPMCGSLAAPHLCVGTVVAVLHARGGGRLLQSSVNKVPAVHLAKARGNESLSEGLCQRGGVKEHGAHEQVTVTCRPYADSRVTAYE